MNPVPDAPPKVGCPILAIFFYRKGGKPRTLKAVSSELGATSYGLQAKFAAILTVASGAKMASITTLLKNP